MKLKLITKVLTLCSKPEKLCEHVFRSLSSCSFTFTLWMFVTFKPHRPSCIFSWLFFGAPFIQAP